MTKTSGTWHTVDHTADLAVEMSAPTTDLLFRVAADALVGVLCGAEEGSPDEDAPSGAQNRTLDLSAQNLPELLVEWLRELLYIQLSEDCILCTATLKALQETNLEADITLRSPSPGELERELKGVTYHDLVVERRDDEWFARVVFDV